MAIEVLEFSQGKSQWDTFLTWGSKWDSKMNGVLGSKRLFWSHICQRSSAYINIKDRPVTCINSVQIVQMFLFAGPEENSVFLLVFLSLVSTACYLYIHIYTWKSFIITLSLFLSHKCRNLFLISFKHKATHFLWMKNSLKLLLV